MQTSDLRFGLVGYGLWGTHHAGAIEKTRGARLAASCDRGSALAQEKKKLLAVDHEMRLSALWGRVKQLIDDGTVGTPQYVLLELSRFPYRLGSEGWRVDINRVR